MAGPAPVGASVAAAGLRMAPGGAELQTDLQAASSPREHEVT